MDARDCLECGDPDCTDKCLGLSRRQTPSLGSYCRHALARRRGGDCRRGGGHLKLRLAADCNSCIAHDHRKWRRTRGRGRPKRLHEGGVARKEVHCRAPRVFLSTCLIADSRVQRFPHLAQKLLHGPRPNPFTLQRRVPASLRSTHRTERRFSLQPAFRMASISQQP
mgnify:CR=1 FL=1